MIHIYKQEWHDFTRYIIVDSPCGCVQLELYPEEQECGGTAFIFGLWVDKIFRQKGVAQRLLDRAEQIAKQEGHKSVVLEWKLKDSPIEIFKWYERRGYEEKEFDGMGEYSKMEKKL